MGFVTRTTDSSSYAVFTPSFQKTGGGDFSFTNIISAADMPAYEIAMQVYDPVNGVWDEVTWDGTGFTDWSDYQEMPLEIGKGYLGFFVNEAKVSGEVAGEETSGGARTFTHSVPSGDYYVFGSAFPVPLQASNFNIADVFDPYTLAIQIYDPIEGAWNEWTWDGTGFTDWSDYLSGDIAGVGEGVLICNSMGDTVQLVETISAN